MDVLDKGFDLPVSGPLPQGRQVEDYLAETQYDAPGRKFVRRIRPAKRVKKAS